MRQRKGGYAMNEAEEIRWFWTAMMVAIGFAMPMIVMVAIALRSLARWIKAGNEAAEHLKQKGTLMR
jgi:hypothetical protein